jgi:hypothetical protein
MVLDHCSFRCWGYFPGGIALDDPLSILAAFEAFVGLLMKSLSFDREVRRNEH